MVSFLIKFNYPFKTITTNLIYSGKKRHFHHNYGLFKQTTFSEKPAWLKKFKVKQAAMQKDDEIPVFLKKGVPDKILYNLTLGMHIIGLIWTFKVIESLDHPPKEN